MNGGYLPPYSVLKEGIAYSADGQAVTMSRDLFHKLMVAANAGSFDPVWYLAEYADVADALQSGAVEDELDHFASAGYEEGRLPAWFAVEEAWYLEAHPDVAEAIAEGVISDARTHFNEVGYFEGRAPEASLAEAVEQWGEVIAASAKIVGEHRGTADSSAE